MGGMQQWTPPGGVGSLSPPVSWLAAPGLLAPAQAWVEDVSQRVAEDVEAEDQ